MNQKNKAAVAIASEQPKNLALITITKLFIASLMAFFLFAMTACGGSEEETGENDETNDVVVEGTETETIEETAALNVDSLVAAINDLRTSIESSIGEAVEMETTEQREKIKQKWKAIHFYTLNDEIVRVKTYPHEGISQRTEEFYFDGGELIMAVIEDNGEGERGKSESELDKIYYYHGGSMIKEVGANTVESEEISSGEELVEEAMEYLSIYEKK